jgi:elongation factor 3
MNKAALQRALKKRAPVPGSAAANPPAPRVVRGPSPSASPAQTARKELKPEDAMGPKKDFQKSVQGAKLAADTGDHEFALTLYLALLQDFKDAPELRNAKVKANVLLMAGKEAMECGEVDTAQSKLRAASELAPANPQVWKAVAEVAKAAGDVAGNAAALEKCVSIAEDKGNYNRSLPLRIRLAEVQESAGDSKAALGTLSGFLAVADAVSAAREDPACTSDLELLRLRMAALEVGSSSLGIHAPDLSAASAEKHAEAINGTSSSGGSGNFTAPASPDSNVTQSPQPRSLDSTPEVRGSKRFLAEFPLGAHHEPEELPPAVDAAQLQGLIQALREADDEKSVAKASAAIVRCVIPVPQEVGWVVSELQVSLGGGGEETVAALTCLRQLCEAAGPAAEPHVVPLLPIVLELCADAQLSLRTAASATVAGMIDCLNRHGLRVVLPMILKALDGRNWRTKEACLRILILLSKHSPQQMACALPEVVPITSKQVWDTKKEVQVAAKEALLAACACIHNPDIEPLSDRLVRVIAHPEESLQTLDALLATTFVSQVDGASLSVIAPLLGKCLRERNSSMRRKASKVIYNMCKLVLEPSDVAPFVPLLLPALQKVVAETSDEEAVEVAQDALNMLLRAMGQGAVAERARKGDCGPCAEEIMSVTEEMVAYLHQAVGGRVISANVLQYVGTLCCGIALFGRGEDGPKEAQSWRVALMPYLNAHLGEGGDQEEAETVYKEFYKLASKYVEEEEKGMDDKDLCNIDFSLAYGGKILLHNTRLRLRVGHRYGLIGPNGAGKTTLMRNIASGNIDGLPPVRTAYVQHDIAGSDTAAGVLGFMTSLPELSGVSSDEVTGSLRGIGFTDTMIAGPVSSLSGGWKMKLALVRAILMDAQVLLMDEPTNHLDTASVAWLTEHLQGLKDVTMMIVSHDTQFLDDVVTDILHYEQQKLVPYHGSLSHFVSLHPEAKSYYTLSAATLRFKFPNPGPLDGINSTTKSILSITNGSYCYPGAETPQLTGLNLKLCLASRVGVVGANGAGKTTLIRLVVRESLPATGDVWAHHNLRIAYVAQHSFHHVEQHLDKSPVEYMQWRFGTGDGTDREARENNVLLKQTEEEAAESSKTGKVETILGRRKTGKTLEYECTFVGMGDEYNRYITLEKLQDMGCQKLVQEADARVAAMAAGLNLRAVTTREIRAHLDDFALAPEFSVHGKIGGLSGGQKVKLVLAAAMWMRPHLLVLDEPTNYLDREALGALSTALNEFGGGVIMISHNQEFLSSICTETWLVEKGTLFTKGAAKESELKTSSGKRKEVEEDEEPVSSGGCTNKTVVFDNLINPKTLRSLSKKEVRKLGKLAEKAEIPLDVYVKAITRDSPEWKWL